MVTIITHVHTATKTVVLEFVEMVARYVHNSVTWFDVINPTTEEIRQLMAECKLPAEFAHDLTAMTPLTEVYSKKGSLKLTLDFPIVKRTDISHPHEIKFIATKRHLITIRFEDIEALHRFAKEFEVLSILSGAKTLTGGTLLISLLTYLYESMQKKLDYLESCFGDIEEGIFSEREKEMVFEISKLSRRVIAFRQATSPHKRLLAELPKHIEVAFSKQNVSLLEPITDSLYHLEERLKSIHQTIYDLRETNEAMLTTKQNEIMKVLTIMAFTMFPLTLLASLFGMNTADTPLVGGPGDFWVIVSIMLFASAAFFVYFRFKRWM